MLKQPAAVTRRFLKIFTLITIILLAPAAFVNFTVAAPQPFQFKVELTQTYSAHGFSFKYPEEMSVREHKVMENSGEVVGFLRGPNPQAVENQWLVIEWKPKPGHSDLNISFEEYASTLSEIVILEKRTESIQSSLMVTAEFEFKGQYGHGKFAVWYDETRDREYIMYFYTDIRNDPTTLETYLETFQGHDES